METTSETGNRPGTAVQHKGKQRVEQILAVAIEILVTEGNSKFTFRQLAEKLGIRLSNLQYYFPSREVLVHTILERFLKQSSDAINELSTGNRKTSSRKRLLAIIDYILEEQQSEKSCKIFRELWAMSSRDEMIAELMAEYYINYSNQLCALFLDISPDMPRAKARKMSVLIVSMIEGLSLFRGYTQRHDSKILGLEKELRSTILRLIA